MPQQSKLSVRYRAGFSVFAVVLLLLMISVPVLADGNGATHQSSSACLPPWPIGTLCIASEVLTKETVTPSGNVSYFRHETTTNTLTAKDGTVLSSGVNTQEYHYLNKEEINQETSNHVTQTTIRNGQTCVFTFDYHFANGQVQIDKADYQCS